MIAFEVGLAIAAVLAIVGPVVYFGMRRYLRWMERMSAREEQRDQDMFGHG